MRTPLPHAVLSAEATWRSMLVATPVHNVAARAERNASGVWEISVPTKRPAYHVPPISWILRLPAQRTIVLDAIGGWVWEMCDGRSSVENIIDAVAAENGLTFHESRVAVTMYVRDLVQRGALAMALKDY